MGRYDGLHRLDTVTMEWSKLDPKRGGMPLPSPKSGARLVALDENKLALFGGYTPKIEHKGKKPFKKPTYSGGVCNEFHVYDIAKGTCMYVCV